MNKQKKKEFATGFICFRIQNEKKLLQIKNALAHRTVKNTL